MRKSISKQDSKLTSSDSELENSEENNEEMIRGEAKVAVER